MGTNTTTQRPPVRTVITGDRAEVYAALLRARSDARLVGITEARVLPDDRLRLVAHLLTPQGRRSRWERVRSWLLGAAKTLAVLLGVAAVAALVWAVVWAVMALVTLVAAVITWIHAHLLGLGLLAVGLVALLLLPGAAGGGCAGLHCGGCRR